MSLYTNPPGTGSLHTNKAKNKENYPDFQGVLVADKYIRPGQVIKLAGWRNVFEWGEIINLRINNYPRHNKGEVKPVYKKKKRTTVEPVEIRRKDAGDLPT